MSKSIHFKSLHGQFLANISARKVVNYNQPESGQCYCLKNCHQKYNGKQAARFCPENGTDRTQHIWPYLNIEKLFLIICQLLASEQLY